MPLPPLTNLSGPDSSRRMAEYLTSISLFVNQIEAELIQVKRDNTNLRQQGIASPEGQRLLQQTVSGLIGARAQALIGDASTADPSLEGVATNPGSGTLTSFSASPSSIFDVANPTTTPALSMDAQSANRVLSGPSSGGAAVPAFRALVGDDLPTAAVKSTNSKVVAGAPYVNDGKIDVTINGVLVSLMTTA